MLSTTLHQTSTLLAADEIPFNISPVCNTILAPPLTSSTELAGGILKSFTRYLVVDPPSLTNILHVTVDVVMLAHLQTPLASSAFDVHIVVFKLVLCAHFTS